MRSWFILTLLGSLIACSTAAEEKLPTVVGEAQQRGVAPVEKFDTYTVFAGGRGSRPMRAQRFEGATWVEWELAFDSSAIYDFSGRPYAVDQYDWNKLVGLKWDFFKPRNNSLLVGWRWNLNTRQIELAPYLHQDGGREMHPPVVQIRPDERLSIRIDWSETKRVRYVFSSAGRAPVTELYTFRVPDHDPWQILHWFGGTQAAPHDIALRVYNTRSGIDTGAEMR